MDIGMCFHRDNDPALLPALARDLDGVVDQLWVIEDCFYTAAPSLAAVALSHSTDLTVGVGIMPARSRPAPVTAMEFATLAALGPGRFIGGIGHGVQPWMAQMGQASSSPLTSLTETLQVVRGLLAGKQVSAQGQYVHAEQVQLDRPAQVPLYAGVQRHRSFAVAGREADGLVLAGAIGPDHVRSALTHAGSPEGFGLVVFSSLIVGRSRAGAYEFAAGWLAEQLQEPSPSMSDLPFYAELRDRFDRGGQAALRDIPPQWWHHLGAIGTIEDAAEHVRLLREAGATGVSFFPSPDPQVARTQIPDVAQLAGQF